MKHNDTRMGLRDAVDGFLFSLRAEGKADRTIEYYDDLLRCSLRYAEDNRWPDNIQAVDARQLRQFLSWVGSRTFEHDAGNGSHLVRKAKSSTACALPPFLAPPTMRDFLPLPLIVQSLLLDSFRSIFWQTRPESGSPASCADGSYCTPASSFPQ